METFHTLYKETAKRDKFTPRPLNYFKQMWKSLNENSNNLAEMRLYIAEQENICHAACGPSFKLKAPDSLAKSLKGVNQSTTFFA